MGTLANIIAAPLTVYRGPVGEAVTELDDLTPPAVTITPAGNWVAVGYVSRDSDFELTYTPTFEPVMVMESNAPIQHILVEEGASFAYTLAEQDFTAYAHAIAGSTLGTTAAGADQTAQDTILIGDIATITVRALLLLGKSPEGGSRVIHIPRALQVDPVTIAHGKSHKPFGVAWTVQSDMTQTAGGRMLRWTDITAVASS